MNNTQRTSDQTDKELSLDDLSPVNGGGIGSLMAWSAANVVSGCIPAAIDLVHHDGYFTKKMYDAEF